MSLKAECHCKWCHCKRGNLYCHVQGVPGLLSSDMDLSHDFISDSMTISDLEYGSLLY